jgi:hypothetical protein
MKTLIVRASVLASVLAASPVLAHDGVHVHPHGSEGWLMIVAALAVIGLAVVIARRR